MRLSINNTSFRANIISKTQAEYLKSRLTSKPNIDIICHESTDKDSANSALAISNFLNSKGINSRIILSKDLKALDIIDASKTFINSKDYKPDLKDRNILCVDFSSFARSPISAIPILKSNDVIGIDHHNGINISDNNIEINEPLNKKDIPQSKADFYVDTSAKSATAIIYRFFEALGEDIDNLTAYELFSGLVSDCSKKGYAVANGKTGTITVSDELIEDKNTYEIYQKLKEKLSEEQIAKIAKSVDIMSHLTPEEEQFKDRLYENLSFSKNSKIAYVALSPKDKEWIKLGGDTERTSTILNRFRQAVLKDEKYKNTEIMLTFYEANGNYRISAHSKNDNLLDYFNFVANKTKGIFNDSMGGHPNRGGGKIETLDENTCTNWVRTFIEAADFFD